MNKISFVYFDVGGVAIKDFSDTDKWDKMFDELGFGKFASEAKAIYSKYDDDICLGKVHINDLVAIYNQDFKINLDPNLSLLNYFIDHFELNTSIWSVVQKLQVSTKTGLLTDMYVGMLDAIFAKKLIPNTSWDCIIDSSVEGLRKPRPEIYELAMLRAGVPAQEILFIDNRQKNLDGAKKAGWQTYLYDSSNYEKSSQDLGEFLSQNL